MKMKRLLSLTLALALTAGLLTGCGSKEEPVPPVPSAPSGSSSATVPGQVEPMDLTGVTDPYLATAGIAGDAVVATVGGYDITAADLLYWVAHNIEAYKQGMAMSGTNEILWDAKVRPGEDTRRKDFFLTNALESAAFYRLLPVIAEEEGLEVSQEDMDFLKNDVKEMEELLGSREAADRMLWAQMSNVEQYCRRYEAGNLYDQLLNLYFGPDSGRYPTDEEVTAYATDEMGAYRAKHILLSTEADEKGTPVDEEVMQEKKQQAEELLAQIRAAEDPAAKFEELMHRYSEDPNLEKLPNGYETGLGQMPKEFEQTAMGLEMGAISDVVQSRHGYHIILRLPFENLETYRTRMINEEMEQVTQGWLKEHGVETTEAYDKLDVRAYYEKVELLQAAVRQEIMAQGGAQKAGN